MSYGGADSALGWNFSSPYDNYNSNYGNNNNIWSGYDWGNTSNFGSNVGGVLGNMPNNATWESRMALLNILNNNNNTQTNAALQREQMAQQNKQHYDNLAWQKEELEKQLAESRYNGDANRANQLQMQKNQLEAQMNQLKYQMEQNAKESEAERGWKTSERLGEQDYDAWSQQQKIQEAARQAELDRQYQENLAAQQYQRNRESQWAQAIYDSNAQKNSIYADMAGMMTDEQKAAGLGELNQATTPYAKWLEQGGVYSQDEISNILNAAYNDVANQTQANVQSYANSMAARGISSSPQAARIMQQQGLTAAAQGRGAARADVNKQQAQSRMDAASGYANLKAQLANLQTAATQSNAMKAAQSIVSPTQWWDQNSTGTNQSWANTGNNGYYTPNTNYSWR